MGIFRTSSLRGSVSRNPERTAPRRQAGRGSHVTQKFCSRGSRLHARRRVLIKGEPDMSSQGIWCFSTCEKVQESGLTTSITSECPSPVWGHHPGFSGPACPGPPGSLSAGAAASATPLACRRGREWSASHSPGRRAPEQRAFLVGVPVPIIPCIPGSQAPSQAVPSVMASGPLALTCDQLPTWLRFLEPGPRLGGWELSLPRRPSCPDPGISPAPSPRVLGPP